MSDRLYFSKARWIWENENPRTDEYIETRETFFCDKSKKQFLSISADSNYTVYINGELAAFGQYADYPHRKIGDRIDVSGFTREGENTVRTEVWYYGTLSQTYAAGKAGVIYEYSEDGEILAFSSSATLSRLHAGYVSHKNKDITGQLGLTYEYDAGNTDIAELTSSVEVSGITYDISLRPIKRTVLRGRTSFYRCFGGAYEIKARSESAAFDMQTASLSFIRASRSESPNAPFDVDTGDGQTYFIVDIGSEECGFLDFDITVPVPCKLTIAYGEHLTDGRVRTGKRNFTCVYHAVRGRNRFLNTFRRFGCRYLEVFAECPSVHVDYIGLRPVEYPLNVKKPDTGNLLRDTIYEVSEKTLALCMHEHYEDCPWREQALYTMDSRNQALAGYYAFREYAFPRASFELMARGVRNDGMLPLCFPSGDEYVIPSFNCVYFIEMREYADYSGDVTLIRECYPVMKRLLDIFIERTGENGLCLNFYGDKAKYWGFFEWAETLSGNFGETVPEYECPLNAFLSLALRSFAVICGKLGLTDESAHYSGLAEKLNRRIREVFRNEKTKLFESFSGRDRGKYSVLVNSLCVLCGAADGTDTSVISEICASNGPGDTGLYVIPNTLSMNIYRFDAMLKLNQGNSAAIIDEIDRTYLHMLRRGATSFWETIKGEADFDGVGSLCHGWSALPIYYYEKLLNK